MDSYRAVHTRSDGKSQIKYASRNKCRCNLCSTYPRWYIVLWRDMYIFAYAIVRKTRINLPVDLIKEKVSSRRHMRERKSYRHMPVISWWYRKQCRASIRNRFAVGESIVFICRKIWMVGNSTNADQLYWTIAECTGIAIVSVLRYTPNAKFCHRSNAISPPLSFRKKKTRFSRDPAVVKRFTVHISSVKSAHFGNTVPAARDESDSTCVNESNRLASTLITGDVYLRFAIDGNVVNDKSVNVSMRLTLNRNGEWAIKTGIDINRHRITELVAICVSVAADDVGCRLLMRK